VNFTQHSAAKDLFQSLKQIGLSQASINAVLPEWWENSLADDPAGLAELKILLARRLSIDPATLFSDASSVEFIPVVRRYKGGREDLMEKLCGSTVIAGSLGRTALRFLDKPQFQLLSNPNELRERILSSGAPWVGLEQLLDLCWAARIPVLHATFPKNVSKFDALVMAEADGYSAVLCRNESSAAWLAFHLAHEIGHIACGHIGVDGMIVDERIEDETSNSTQQQEVEANEYAIKLLGSYGLDLPVFNSFSSYSEIAGSAIKLGYKNKVLPGHLILKGAKRNGNFPLARRALGRAEEEIDARDIINDRAHVELSRAGWTDEAEEFITKFVWKKAKG